MMGENGLKLYEGRFKLDIRKCLFFDSGDAVAQAAQAAGADIIPAGVGEKDACGTEGRGQWG